MTEDHPGSPAARLEAAFGRIWRTRMAGLPFLNPALCVEAVGFRPWQGQWLGALVTPWSVNLVLMPGEGHWPSLPQGAERFVDLPAGRFRFIAGVDGDIGEHHACSLFSPALDFADHAAARAVAEASLAALFDLPGVERQASGAEAGGSSPGGGASRVSKRDFLRGKFSGAARADRG